MHVNGVPTIVLTLVRFFAGSLVLILMMMSISGIRFFELLLTFLFRDLFAPDRDPEQSSWQRVERYHDVLGRQPYLHFAEPFSALHLLSLVMFVAAVTFAIRAALTNHIPLTIAALAWIVGLTVLDQEFVIVDLWSYVRIASSAVLIAYTAFARSANETMDKQSSVTPTMDTMGREA